MCVFVCSWGEGTMDKGKHYIKIISYRLVALLLLALVAGVEAGENFARVKCFMDNDSLKNQCFRYCFNVYLSGLYISFLLLLEPITTNLVS